MIGDTLPIPVNNGDPIPTPGGTGGEQLVVTQEAGGIKPATPIVAQTTPSSTNNQVIQPITGSDAIFVQPSPSGITNKKSRDDSIRHYDNEVRKVIGQYATDPYMETQKVGELKRNYMKDIYNRIIRLPQT